MKFTFEERLVDSPFIKKIWRTQSEHPGTFISRASTCWGMVVTKHEDQTIFTVRGPETKATVIDYSWSAAEFFGIDFRPGTYMPHLPPGKVRDLSDVNLPGATRTSFWLHGSVWQYPEFENADIFVDWLDRKGLLVRDPVVDAALLGHPQKMSLRSVQYRFLHVTGLTYTTLKQIERARQAATLLEQGMSILDVVNTVGYADQPHLTRSLKRFAGQTPAQIIRENTPE